jgi:hypothetical protein
VAEAIGRDAWLAARTLTRTPVGTLSKPLFSGLSSAAPRLRVRALQRAASVLTAWSVT